jgi:hypothetical protein
MRMKNTHYDGNASAALARREVVFGLPSARGNAPHMTREAADDEGKRLNAGRYETVEQMDAQLDTRARVFARAPAALGEAPSVLQEAPSTSDGFGLFGGLLFFAAGAALVYVLTKHSGEDEEDEGGMPALPAPEPTPVAAPPALVAPTPVLAVPAVAVPTPPVPVLATSPRRRRVRATSSSVRVL